MAEDKKRTAGYAAAGAGTAALGMPVRVASNAKKNPLAKLPEGVRTVPITDAHHIARKTGQRLMNDRYTSRMAGAMIDGQRPEHFDNPMHVHRFSDGHMHSSGMHRLWAKTMVGDTTTKVHIQDVHGPRPTKPLAAEAILRAGTRQQKKRLASGPRSPEKIHSQAGKFTDWADRQNKRLSGGHSTELKVKNPGISEAALHTRQAAFLAGGAAAGLGVKHVVDVHRQQVAKRDITDEELRTRKKIQGKIGRTTSTMGLTGVAMLGTSLAMKRSPRFATKVATTPGLRRLGNADQIREKAQNLGLVAGGIGGIGGFNQARIYTEESKHKRLSKALSMESEHDMEPVYGEFSKKAFDTEEKKRGTAYGAVGGILGAPGAAAGSALAAPSGAKLQGAAAGAVGGFLGGPVGGGVAGHYAGSLHSRLKPLKRKKKTDITKSAFGVSHD